LNRGISLHCHFAKEYATGASELNGQRRPKLTDMASGKSP
jgi:hypothetical protein